VFLNFYAARHTDLAILKLCKKCLLSVYIYILVLHKGMLALYLRKSLPLEKSLKKQYDFKTLLTPLKCGFHYTDVYETSNQCALVDITFTEYFPNRIEVVEHREMSHLHRKVNNVFQCAFFTLNNTT